MVLADREVLLLLLCLVAPPLALSAGTRRKSNVNFKILMVFLQEILGFLMTDTRFVHTGRQVGLVSRLLTEKIEDLC